jgi:hypothetical protein
MRDARTIETSSLNSWDMSVCVSRSAILAGLVQPTELDMSFVSLRHSRISEKASPFLLEATCCFNVANSAVNCVVCVRFWANSCIGQHLVSTWRAALCVGCTVYPAHIRLWWISSYTLHGNKPN